MKVNSTNPSKGLSLIEALVLLAVVAVLLAFANPMFRDNSARAAVKEATVQVALALHNAKNSARSTNSDVTVVITTNPSGNTVSFKFPNDRSTGTLPVVTLPGGISVSSDSPAFTFNAQGAVNTTGSITLASAANTNFYATIKLNTLSSRVKTSYGLQGVQST